MQLTHFLREGRLITDGRRHAPQQRGNFRARLHETENVINKQQHVPVLDVAEILCHGKACQGHTHTHARRLVHLPEDHGGLLNRAAFLHFIPKVVALPASLADAGKNGISAVLQRHIVDQFLDQNRFANARAAEQADLSASGVGLQKIDDLDAGLEHLSRRILLRKGRGLAVNVPALAFSDRIPPVDRLSQSVEHAADGPGAYRHLDGFTGGLHFHIPGKSFALRKNDAAYGIIAQQLGHLHNACPALDFHGQCIAKPGDGHCIELNVDHGA